MYPHSSTSIPTSSLRRQTPILYWFFLLLLCSAYLQGGLEKLWNFQAALAEMRHFGMEPARLFAMVTIVGELGASLMILTGRLRWIGALYLAMFTFAANFLANVSGCSKAWCARCPKTASTNISVWWVRFSSSRGSISTRAMATQAQPDFLDPPLAREERPTAGISVATMTATRSRPHYLGS